MDCSVFSFLVLYVVQLWYFKCLSVVPVDMDNCNEQMVLSIIRHPRSMILKHPAYRLNNWTAHLNSDVPNRREIMNTNSTGKFSAFLSFITSSLYLSLFLMEVVLFVLCVSGPAHILCLTVASGWNKERCTSEIDILTFTERSPFQLNCFILCMVIIHDVHNFNGALAVLILFRNNA
jgi:hypothetical protein